MKLKNYDVILIGAGISGLSSAQLLKKRGYSVLVLEKSDSVGGLIKCKTVEGNLYHLVGGHVFNTKIPDVLTFFWEHCESKQFLKAKRNAKIRIQERLIDYPIENNIGQLNQEDASIILSELLEIYKSGAQAEQDSFGDFLVATFGRRLCEIYFLPYNRKIWGLEPREMALKWLDGKLPMPSVIEIIQANICRKEDNMVHSSFFYPSEGGSQFIADSLAKGVEIELNTPCVHIETTFAPDFLIVNNKYKARALIYTCDVRRLNDMLFPGKLSATVESDLSMLKSHGTTNLLCSSEACDTSWEYIPQANIKSHRVIYTGNFSRNNTSALMKRAGLNTCTIEFTGELTASEASAEARKIPGIRDIISYHYNPSTYVIHDSTTKSVMRDAKKTLRGLNIWLSGRFAEWEYYNMDTAIHAAMRTVASISEEL